MKIKLRWEFNEARDIYSCFIEFLNDRTKINIKKYDDVWSIEFSYDYDIWWDLCDDEGDEDYKTVEDAMEFVENFVAEKLSKFIAEVNYNDVV